MDRDYLIVLYGSHARGSADAHSDVDLLVIGDASEARVGAAAPELPGPRSVSRYTWEEVDAMIGYGSLFLHHVKREGVRLEQRGAHAESFWSRLERLPRYAHARRDARRFRDTVVDVREALASGGSPAYELSVIVSVIRHSAVLGCYLTGQICFGRTEPLATLLGAWCLPQEWATRYRSMYAFQFESPQNAAASGRLTSGNVLAWADIADRLLDKLDVEVARYEENLPSAA